MKAVDGISQPGPFLTENASVSRTQVPINAPNLLKPHVPQSIASFVHDKTTQNIAF
jgi:hypothetical protein